MRHEEALITLGRSQPGKRPLGPSNPVWKLSHMRSMREGKREEEKGMGKGRRTHALGTRNASMRRGGRWAVDVE